MKGTNTKAARTKAEENKENKRSPAKAEYPHLPQPQQPAGLHQALGNRAQAGTQQQQQLASEETVSFLGQLLVQGLIQCLKPQVKEKGQGQEKEQEPEKEQEKRSPTLDLVKLMSILTCQ